MGGIKITGGIPLKGEVRIQGSKNAALPVMAAALLNKGETILHGCPQISDVFLMERILNNLGVKTKWEGHTLEIHAETLQMPRVEMELGRQMRSTIIFLGSLLGRCREALIPYPGGCVIGERPVDMHLQALKSLGAKFIEMKDGLYAYTGGLSGAEITFSKVSVGATQNAILGAVCADGISILRGCSREPEVVWLCRFLNQAGGKIEGIGSSQLVIQGVKNLHDTEFQIPPDRIAAGTYVCASAITRGEGVLIDAPVDEMKALLMAYEKIGGQYAYNSGKLSLCSLKAEHSAGSIETQVYPGFPTDLQSVLMAVLAAGKEESFLTENIFENRFRIVPQLQKMGADIQVYKNTAVIRGRNLKGEAVEAKELRGGAALVIAGLGADGETYVKNKGFIERGYEDICRDLKSLGGRIEAD